MTIVAYRNGILASDSQIQQGNTRSGTGRKIVKTKDGFLAGAAGDFASITEFLKWAEGNKQESFGELENFEGLLIYPNRKIVSYDSEGIALDIKSEFYVLGAGGDIALGAMEFGATPQEAVEAAIKWSTACGGKIQVVKL